MNSDRKTYKLIKVENCGKNLYLEKRNVVQSALVFGTSIIASTLLTISVANGNISIFGSDLATLLVAGISCREMACSLDKQKKLQKKVDGFKTTVRYINDGNVKLK